MIVEIRRAFKVLRHDMPHVGRIQIRQNMRVRTQHRVAQEIF